jgi:hypothetical protein
MEVEEGIDPSNDGFAIHQEFLRPLLDGEHL